MSQFEWPNRGYVIVTARMLAISSRTGYDHEMSMSVDGTRYTLVYKEIQALSVSFGIIRALRQQ